MTTRERAEAELASGEAYEYEYRLKVSPTERAVAFAESEYARGRREAFEEAANYHEAKATEALDGIEYARICGFSSDLVLKSDREKAVAELFRKMAREVKP